jgi:hypothetical protein
MLESKVLTRSSERTGRAPPRACAKGGGGAPCFDEGIAPAISSLPDDHRFSALPEFALEIVGSDA